MDAYSIVSSICQGIQAAIGAGEGCRSNKSCCRTLVARLRLLKNLLEGIRDAELAFSTRAGKHLESLERAVRKAERLLNQCKGSRSKIFEVLQAEFVVASFQEIAAELVQCLNELPSVLLKAPLKITLEVREVRSELLCAKFAADAGIERTAVRLRKLVEQSQYKRDLSRSDLVGLAEELRLETAESLLRERAALHRESIIVSAEKCAQEEALIQILMDLLEHLCKDRAEQQRWKQGGMPAVPEDYRCPLSLELMADPVVVASGQTYERAYIEQWLKDGNRTCPKTRQPLLHTCVIPNFTVKGLIATWCESNGVPYPDPPQLDQLVLSADDGGAKDDPKLDMASKLPPGSVRSDPIVGVVRNDAPAAVVSSAEERETMASQGLGPGCCDQAGGQKGDAANEASAGRTIGRSSPYRRVSPAKPLEGLAWQRKTPLLDRRSSWTSSSYLRELASPRSPSPNGNPVQSFDLPANEGHSALSLPTALPRTASGNETSPSSASGPGTPSVSEPFQDLGQGGDSPLDSTPSGNGDSFEFGGSGVYSEAGTMLLGRRSIDSRPPCFNSAALGSSGGLEPKHHEEEEVPVLPLVEALRHGTSEEQRSAAQRIRSLAKFSMVNRTRIAAAGGIEPLVQLLKSHEPETVEQAVTALLNVSINEGNKGSIAASGAIELLVDVLQTGTEVARENAAATLFSLSVMDENKITIGSSGAIPPLVDLLINGSERGKKDACTALFNLSIYGGNRARIVRAGAVKELVRQLSTNMVDKACAVLANLAGIAEGREAMVEEGGIPLLVEVLESGSSKGKENAVAALLHLSLSTARHSSLVLQEGAIPPLVALSQAGTARAKEKANALLKHFREQRQTGLVKHGSLQNKAHLACK